VDDAPQASTLPSAGRQCRNTSIGAAPPAIDAPLINDWNLGMKIRSSYSGGSEPQSEREAELVPTPALALIRALARHEAWLDQNKRLERQLRLIDLSVLTPIV